MKVTVFSFKEQATLAKSFSEYLDCQYSQASIHTFPDQENCVKVIPGDVTDTCIVFASLYHPDSVTTPLLFLSETLRDYGANRIILIAPYLAYMRQDKQFREGEGISAKYYARLISDYFDVLVTIDPHLHRIHDLNAIYTIPAYNIHAASVIVTWIKDNIEQPLLVGPDSESEQWVSDLSRRVDAPYIVLNKNRKGDRDVEVSVPELEQWMQHIPVLVDDIISTGKTMLETIKHLKQSGFKAPVCIGIHGIFSDNAYEELLVAGAKRIITTNSITHPSNEIDLARLIAEKFQHLNIIEMIIMNDS